MDHVRYLWNLIIKNQNKLSEKRSWKNIVEIIKKKYYNLN